MRTPFLISGILASATVVAASTSSVSAFTISGNTISNINSGDINEMFTVTFDQGTGEISSDLSAQAQFTVTDWEVEDIGGVDYTVATFSVRVRNTSASNSRIYRLGFDTNSNIDESESTFTDNNNQDQRFNLSSSGSGAEVCLYSNGNCSGGSNGVTQGQTGDYTVRLALENSSGGFELDLNNFYVGYESSRGTGGTGTNYQTVMASSVDAPEPLTLLGTGMAAGFGAIFRREQQKKRKQKEKVEI